MQASVSYQQTLKSLGYSQLEKYFRYLNFMCDFIGTFKCMYFVTSFKNILICAWMFVYYSHSLGGIFVKVKGFSMFFKKKKN